MDVFGNDWGKIASFVSGELRHARGRTWREVLAHVKKMQNNPTPEFRQALSVQIAEMMDEKLRKQRARKWNKIEVSFRASAFYARPSSLSLSLSLSLSVFFSFFFPKGRQGSEHVTALPESDDNEAGNSDRKVASPLQTHLPRLALEDPHHWWRTTMRSSRYGCAPMVDASELSFRMLVRNHGTDFAYTPMLHAKNFVLNRIYRQNFFSTCEQDRPLLVQFCARDAQEICLAGLMAESVCDGIDLNLGCPQKIAKKGGYGAFLMDELELVYEMVSALRRTLSVPITCKIRCFPDVEDTVRYAQMLVKAGAHMVCGTFCALGEGCVRVCVVYGN
jgi:Dihydrouridine synthase (Dus)